MVIYGKYCEVLYIRLGKKKNIYIFLKLLYTNFPAYNNLNLGNLI